MKRILMCFLLCLTLVKSRSRRIRHENREAIQDEFNQRVQNVNRYWRCNIPKPRLVYLDDSSNDINFVSEPNILWIPAVAVLHRCDQSTGCCSNPGFKCKPIKTEQVSLVFKRVDMIQGGQGTFERFTFRNHTKCACLHENQRASEL